MLTGYVVAKSDPAKAEQLIKAVMAPNEVNAVGPVPADRMKAFGLRSDDFTCPQPWP